MRGKPLSSQRNRVGPHLHWGEFLTKRLQTGQTYKNPEVMIGYVRCAMQPVEVQTSLLGFFLFQNFTLLHVNWHKIIHVLFSARKVEFIQFYWRLGGGVDGGGRHASVIPLSSQSLSYWHLFLNLFPYFSSPLPSMLPHKTPNSSLIL